METILTRFEKWVQKTPLATAVIFENQSFTYQALNDHSNLLASRLQCLNVEPEMRIALCMERSLEQIIAMLAVLKVGCAYVPLDPLQPAARLNLILNDSNAYILLTKLNYQHLFNNYKGNVICLDGDEDTSTENNVFFMPLNADNAAYVIDTSGTTGIPKGVLIEHRSVVNFGQWFAKFSELHASQRIDWSGNYSFDMAVATSIVPLMFGLTIVMCSDEIKKNIPAYLRYLQSNKINVIKLTPGYFKYLLREVSTNYLPLPSLQTIILGGERLRTVECRAWLDLYPEHTLFNEYGPTETTVAVSQQKICKTNIDSFKVNIPIGTIGSHVDYWILNSHNRPVIEGELGELHIGGVCLAREYINQPELTKQKFIQLNLSSISAVSSSQAPRGRRRVYKTGDLCRQLPNGVIEYLGRMDKQVKIRGFRIELSEIEHCLCTHPDIIDAVVIMHEDQHNDAKLIAYCIINKHNQLINHTKIRKFLQDYLPDYMIPCIFVPVHDFPLTANGKLNQAALPLPSFSNSQNYQAPRSALEKTLVKIWSKEFDLSLIGIHDKFYELGGHSLHASRIVSEINNKFKKNITMADFYHADTIATLSKIIKKAAVKKPANKNPSSTIPTKTMPLSDFQLLLWLSKTFEPKAGKLNIISRKRWHGQLNSDALAFAFDAVIKRHEILGYRITRLYPAQRLQPRLHFDVNKTWLTDYSIPESEETVLTSFKELINFYPWPKRHPLIKARLFYLPNEETELQICLSHLISDQISLEILWNNLSKYYHDFIAHKDHPKKLLALHQTRSFHHYIMMEKGIIETNFEEDAIFWNNYLKDAQLFSFPSQFVVRDMQAQKLSYSTYKEVPSHIFCLIKQFCTIHHVSESDILYAATSIALRNIARTHHNSIDYILMNIVKSTRDDQIYDETIGCFVRVDPLTVNVDEEATVLSIAEQIHQTLINNANHIRASSIVKLASIATKIRKQKKAFLIQFLILNYAKILRFFHLHYKALRVVSHLSALKKENGFTICVNLWNNFVLSKKMSDCDFELKPIKMPIVQYDIANFDNILDVCFLRDENKEKPWLVISSNLKPDFRKQIADEIISVISNC